MDPTATWWPKLDGALRPSSDSSWKPRCVRALREVISRFLNEKLLNVRRSKAIRRAYANSFRLWSSCCLEIEASETEVRPGTASTHSQAFGRRGRLIKDRDPFCRP